VRRSTQHHKLIQEAAAHHFLVRRLLLDVDSSLEIGAIVNGDALGRDVARDNGRLPSAPSLIGMISGFTSTGARSQRCACGPAWIFGRFSYGSDIVIWKARCGIQSRVGVRRDGIRLMRFLLERKGATRFSRVFAGAKMSFKLQKSLYCTSLFETNLMNSWKSSPSNNGSRNCVRRP
jgi:hypothetical protein